MISEMLPGKPMQTMLGATALTWLQFALATPVALWGSWPFFQRGWQSIVNRHLNTFTLVALDTGAAFLYSVAATVMPGVFPETFRDHHTGAASVYLLRAGCRDRNSDAARSGARTARTRPHIERTQSTARLAPRTARILRGNGAEEDISIDQVKARPPATSAPV